MSRLFLRAPCAISSATRSFQTTTKLGTFRRPTEDEDPWPKPKEWPMENWKMYPPQEEGEARRRASYCHFRENVKYSPKKMWYICCLVRGLTVDEAIKQLSFVPKKGAHILKEVIEEARDIAINEHHFEFKSNMWIGECNCEKGIVFKGVRKHAYFRFGIIHYFHTHILVRLVEGPPPKHFYHDPLTNREKLDHYIDDLRRRKVKYTL